MPDFTILQGGKDVQLDLFDDFFKENREETVELYVNFLKDNKSLPIFDTNHFSKLVGYSEEFLYAVSASPHSFYREFSIRKSSGGIRVISEPLPTLKHVQRFIIDEVLTHVEPHKVAKAFRKNHTLRGPAVIHKARPYMLKLDIKDFFSSISGYDVYKIFYDIGYTKQISRLLSGLCTLNDSLPQGSPSSPMLSNLFLRDFDQHIFNICLEMKIFYTRYADDMTLSSKEKNLIPLVDLVRENLRKKDLHLNNRKTSYSGKGARKYVNGIVVNDRPNILKTERSELRKIMYYIRKYGINGHMRMAEVNIPNYIDHIIGRLTYAHFVTREPLFLDESRYLRALKNYI